MELPIKASETILEFRFTGTFIPEQITPYWLVKNDIINSKEAEVYKQLTNSNISSFHYRFLNFTIEKDYFSISTNQASTLVLLVDMVQSISPLIKTVAKESYSLKTNFHIKLKNKSEVLKIVKSQTKLHSWESLFPEHRPKGITFEKRNLIKPFEVLTNVHMSYCPKRMNSDNIHVFIEHNINHSFKPHTKSPVRMYPRADIFNIERDFIDSLTKISLDTLALFKANYLS